MTRTPVRAAPRWPRTTAVTALGFARPARVGNPRGMALETPPRFSRGTTEGRRAVPRGPGEDAVPRGLAVASAVMLRLLIVVGGLALLALAAQRLLLVVMPFLIALLLSTLLSPLARRLER